MATQLADYQIPKQCHATGRRVVNRMLQRSRGHRIRSLFDFASQEIVIPEGKHEGKRWRPYFQPYAGVLFQAMGDPRWSRFAVTGCVQSGKSFASFVVPCIYHLCELREPVILAAPTMDVARDKWKREIEPVFRKTRYSVLLPDEGSGSRGGFRELIELRNGAVLKFMSAGGGDEKRSSFSSRVVIMTEVDKMDEAGTKSREASPIRQIIARTESYDLDEARIYLECTVSIEEGAIWREYNAGSASRLAVPCPGCKAWICPEREHFTGVFECDSVHLAEEKGAFCCYECGYVFSEHARQESLTQMRLVHRGQSIDKDTLDVVGAETPTRQLGFRWSAFHNAFWSQRKVAYGEYQALRDRDADDAEKYQKQFVWVVPYQPQDLEVTRLREEDVTITTGAITRNLVPSWAEWVTCGVDVGKSWVHWVTVAWRKDLTSCPEDEPAAGVLDYGAYQIEYGPQMDRSIESALSRVLANLTKGYQLRGEAEMVSPSRGLVDARYSTKAVRSAVKAADQRIWFTQFGYGSGAHFRKSYASPKRQSRLVSQIRDGYHLEYLPPWGMKEFKLDVDAWKSWITRRFSSRVGPGSIGLFEASPHVHRTFFNHLTAEEETRTFDIKQNKEVTKWERVRKQNHYFDAITYAAVAADSLGMVTLDTEKKEAEKKSAGIASLLKAAKKSMAKSVFGDQYPGRYESG